MLEIFDKAREYARQAMTRSEHRAVSVKLRKEGKIGEWRLHHQAFKLFRLAQDHCAEYRLQSPQKQSDEQMTIGEVIEEINCMQGKHGYGWDHEGEWYIKDYRSPEGLKATLGFLHDMGIEYVREDSNPLSEAVHLRVSESDFDVIFNPLKDVESGHGWQNKPGIEVISAEEWQKRYGKNREEDRGRG